MSEHVPIVRINGHAPTVEALARFALINDGHFTAMQVRRRSVRGLDLHLQRLHAAHRSLYGTDLNVENVHQLIREAVAVHADASVRVTVAEPDPGVPIVMTAVRPPAETASGPVSLAPVSWLRGVPEVKHVGTFPQIQYARQARAAGFDDAVFVDTEGNISETATANIAFVTGDQVVWPEGPALRGITWQLLEHALPAHGVASRTAVVNRRDLDTFDGAILVNSIGVAPVGSIGAHRFRVSEKSSQRLAAIYDSVPAQPI